MPNLHDYPDESSDSRGGRGPFHEMPVAIRTDLAEDHVLELVGLLRGVAISKFGVPPADADELIQDVFITYLRNPLNVHGDVCRYLVGGVCNASRNYWRARRARERMFSDVDELVGVAEANEDILRELTAQSTLKATFSRLPSRCREALCRYYIEEEDTSTIAAAFETSRRNVNYIVHICRKRARAIYEEISRLP